MACIALSLSACNGGTATGTGALSLAITDAPVLEDVEVCVHFSSITLHHADGDRLQIPYDPASYYDATDGCSSNVPSDDPGALHNAVALSAMQGARTVTLLDSRDVKAGV